MKPINPHLWRKFEQAQSNMLKFFRAGNWHAAKKWGRTMQSLLLRVIGVPAWERQWLARRANRHGWEHKDSASYSNPAVRARMRQDSQGGEAARQGGWQRLDARLKKGPENPTS